MTKPMSLQEFAALTESFANFWMKRCCGVAGQRKCDVIHVLLVRNAFEKTKCSCPGKTLN